MPSALLQVAVLLAQAEALAPGPSAAQTPPPPPPVWTEAAVRLTYRPAPASDEAGPALGFGFGFGLGMRYGLPCGHFEFGTSLDFGYAHHQREVVGVRVLPNGTEESFEGQREITENTFGVLQVATLLAGRWRPWGGLGGGLAVGFFDSPERSFRPGSDRAYRAYGHAAIGLQFVVQGQTYLNLRLDHQGMLGDAAFATSDGQSRRVFGDLVMAGISLGSRLP